MSARRILINRSVASRELRGRVDLKRVDSTTDEDIAAQIAADDAQAMLDAAKYARNVRIRLGLSQAELSKRINVPVETIRNWEQGTDPKFRQEPYEQTKSFS